MPTLSEDNKNVVLVKTWHKRNIKTETYRFLITQFGINSPSCDESCNNSLNRAKLGSSLLSKRQHHSGIEDLTVLVLSDFGSGPPRRPVSSASIKATSSVESEKSKISKFSLIRSMFTDLGIAEWPSSICQRRITWAGDLPCCSAIRMIVGCVSGSSSGLGSSVK